MKFAESQNPGGKLERERSRAKADEKAKQQARAEEAKPTTESNRSSEDRPEPTTKTTTRDMDWGDRFKANDKKNDFPTHEDVAKPTIFEIIKDRICVIL